VVFGCGIPALLGFVLFATIFAAAFNRGFGKGRERGRQLVCQRNLQEIATASAMYAQDYGATLPPPARWSETIRPYISRTGARDTAIRQLAIKVDADHPFRCPSRVDAPSKKTYGYAYNTAVAGQATAAIRTPITTPIYFDSDTMTKDASDAGTSLPKFGRHAGYNNIAYVDGHVRRLRAGAPDRSVGRGPAYPLGDDSDAP